MKNAPGVLSLLGALATLTGPAFAQGDAQAGAEVYEKNCSECHGERLESSGAIPDLRELRASDRALFDKAVREGTSQMPAWAGILSDAEIDQIWAYIRSRAR